MRLSKVVRPLAFLFLSSLLSACSADGPQVEIGGHRFSVELADDPGKRQLGLMFRRQMDADHGMWFIFEEQKPRAFWMKNCRIPLDIIYFDRNYRIVSIQANVKPCKQPRCPGYPSEGPAQYVLELNGGKAAEIGLKKGDLIEVSL